MTTHRNCHVDIDPIDRFYALSAIFQPYNGGIDPTMTIYMHIHVYNSSTFDSPLLAYLMLTL